MPVFFNGRLWTSPAAMSLVDDSAMANRNLAVGNIIALVGTSEGGEPNTPLRFGAPSEAVATLRGGTLLEAVKKAFDASAEVNGPATVVGVRVNPATQAALTLQTGGAVDIILLESTDYGLWTNQIKAKVEAATTKGRKLSTQNGDDYYTQDDVYRDCFSVQYTGAEATATISVSSLTDKNVLLKAPAATTVATIDLNLYDTVQKLVDRINAVSGFTATVLDGNGDKPVIESLEQVSNSDCKTAALTITGDVAACIDWFNSAGEGFVTATLSAGGNILPLTATPWTYLTGGADGTVTADEWADAFEALQAEDVQWVVPLTSDASIHAAADAHVSYMSEVARKERRAFVGGAAGQTAAEAIAAAKLINSDRTAQCFPGYYDYDAAGVLALHPSYMTAAMIAAGFAGSNPGTAMTNKSFKARGLETRLRNPTDTDPLIDAGVLCLEDTPTGYRCVKSITTWLTNDNYNRVEVSVGWATDYTARTVREAAQRFIGEKGSPRTMGLAGAAVETALRELSRPEPAGPGILVGDDENPPYKNIQLELEGDVLRIEFQCSPVIPINYIPITLHIVPYSGSLLLSAA